MTARAMIEVAARKFRGPDYLLDPRLSLRTLAGIAVRRIAGLSRCLLRGIVWSTDIRRLVFVGAGVELRNRQCIYLGGGVTIGKYVTIDGLSVEGVHIDQGVSIGPYTIIEATGVITNLGRGCWIGRKSGIGAFSFIGAAGGVRIGENVIMGQRVSFHSENHVFDRTDVPICSQGVTRQGIVVEDDCWVGANVVFLDGAHVGRGCVVAAGAVVRGEIPPYSVIGGVPAKVLKSRQTEPA
ncbi:MAG TPA: DapH/DapD/GlmU-related protein [Pirellulales bacterium]|jgi:acetyltransferase-like isoleucine patch superfamily enzyme|nr:DapH/DapD/GlmU-related protein [Pirellulales bacterium]